MVDNDLKLRVFFFFFTKEDHSNKGPLIIHKFVIKKQIIHSFLSY
jgi:hypothetical protein